MNKSCLLLLALSLTACARAKYVEPSAGAARAAGALTCQATFPAKQLCFGVTWEALSFGRGAKSSFILKVGRANVGDETLLPLELADVPDVELSMPDMGHGTDPVKVERLDVGTYRVRRVHLEHGGLWEIKVRLVEGGHVVDEAALRKTL